MNELEIYGQGTNYNSGTHQREPLLHVRRPLSSSSSSSGGGISNDDETFVIVAFIILLCIVGVILYFAIKCAIKGIKSFIAYIQARRLLREAERAKIEAVRYEELRRLVAPLEDLAPVPDAPPPFVQKPKTEVELRAEAEDEWNRRLASKRLI
jgi:hypothetical protein